jgi:GR25 family glycosyltransferase involved in LPS biosynthesis
MKQLLLMIVCIFSLHADIEDHLRAVGEKFNLPQMRNIDFIYLINLDKRPEKLASCMQQLAPYNIHPHRFSAVNGWELPLEVINDVGVKYGPWMAGGQWGSCYLAEENGKRRDEMIHVVGRTYFFHQVAPGAIGCVLSHLSVIQDAFHSGYETIWIMEDDIEIIQNPHLISDRIQQLDTLVGKDGWDILFTDQDSKGQDGNYVPCLSHSVRPNFTPANPKRFAERVVLGANFKRIGARYGSYSMILRRSGMEKILNHYKNYGIFLPYDMEYTMPNTIRLFAVIDDIVSTQPMAPTDNGRPDYKKN